jgi:hypothetical protein
MPQVRSALRTCGYRKGFSRAYAFSRRPARQRAGYQGEARRRGLSEAA